MACKPFFLYMLVDQSGFFLSIDDTLRSIWLECCMHSSAFRINGDKGNCIYSSAKFDEGVIEETPLSKLTLGSIFEHLYDFGSSTYTIGCVIQTIETDTPLVMFEKNECLPVAQNTMATKYCVICKKNKKKTQATYFCIECASGRGQVNLCDVHSEEHECDQSVHSIANSPREGSCGFEDLGDKVGKIQFKGNPSNTVNDNKRKHSDDDD